MRDRAGRTDEEEGRDGGGEGSEADHRAPFGRRVALDSTALRVGRIWRSLTSRGNTGRMTRLAHPYRDLDVIDSRAPRFNQATIGTLSVLAVATGWWWLLAVLAAQLWIGLTARAAVLPSLPRLLRARATALRRRPARGLPAAALRESRRRCLPLRGGCVLLRRGSASPAAFSAVSSLRLRFSRPSRASALDARRTSSAAGCAGARSSPVRCRRGRQASTS